MSTAPPKSEAQRLMFRPKRCPMIIPSTEKMNVTVNIIAVGAVMSISSIENDTPTASASMLVARDSPIRFLVFHGQHDVFTLFPSSVGIGFIGTVDVVFCGSNIIVTVANLIFFFVFGENVIGYHFYRRGQAILRRLSSGPNFRLAI